MTKLCRHDCDCVMLTVRCEVCCTEFASWVARPVLGRLEEKVQSPIWPTRATLLQSISLLWRKQFMCFEWVEEKTVFLKLGDFESVVVTSLLHCNVCTKKWPSGVSIRGGGGGILGFERCRDHPQWQGPAVYHAAPGPLQPAPTKAQRLSTRRPTPFRSYPGSVNKLVPPSWSTRIHCGLICGWQVGCTQGGKVGSCLTDEHWSAVLSVG